MATIKVSSQTQLLSALKTATGGDTILLADGKYGSVTLANKFASTVTIKAEHPQGASFTAITVKGGDNLAFNGLKLDTNFSATFSSDISLTNSVTTNGTVYFREVNGLVVDKVTATGGQYSILLNSIQNFSVTNSTFGKVTEDVMRITGNSYNGVIENNTLSDTIATYPTHPDLLQMFAVNGITPRDIAIRGNLMYDNPATGGVAAQGIFMSDPSSGGYKNILIENNLINVNSPNSIYINGGQKNVAILNNTLIPGANDGGAIIRLAEKAGMSNAGTTLSGNIAKLILDETGSSHILSNYLYGRNADISSLFHGTNGSTWENFVPVEGSPIDFGSPFGAQARLSSLLQTYYGHVGTATPVPASGEAAVISGPTSVLHLDTSFEMGGVKRDIVALAHDKVMALDTGSIHVSFNADTVSGGSRGLISKSAIGYADDFSAWIQSGTLNLCFENEDGQQVRISAPNIKANTDYDLLITFDEEKVIVWLNDTKIGEAQFDLDLSDNGDYLVLGGVNGQSTRGTIDKVASFFDGSISNLSVYDAVLTPAEFSALENQRHAQDLALGSTAQIS
jgi:hypothetical protein